MAATNFHDLIDQALADGEVVKTQVKKTKGSDAYGYFDFVGGTYGGMRLRLYPPFEPFTHRPVATGNEAPKEERWVLDRQFKKNGDQTRSVYRLETP